MWPTNNYAVYLFIDDQNNNKEDNYLERTDINVGWGYWGIDLTALYVPCSQGSKRHPHRLLVERDIRRDWWMRVGKGWFESRDASWGCRMIRGRGMSRRRRRRGRSVSVWDRPSPSDPQLPRRNCVRLSVWWFFGSSYNLQNTIFCHLVENHNFSL